MHGRRFTRPLLLTPQHQHPAITRCDKKIVASRIDKDACSLTSNERDPIISNTCRAFDYIHSAAILRSHKTELSATGAPSLGGQGNAAEKERAPQEGGPFHSLGSYSLLAYRATVRSKWPVPPLPPSRGRPYFLLASFEEKLWDHSGRKPPNSETRQLTHVEPRNQLGSQLDSSHPAPANPYPR